ncbi:MAG TPA: hypothetical protein VMW42_06585 [Desulfatiglandales bacterium]|nr:hypothetical protein [Desulfatiglandales bacterium]
MAKQRKIFIYVIIVNSYDYLKRTTEGKMRGKLAQCLYERQIFDIYKLAYFINTIEASGVIASVFIG